jgi:nucleoside-diphosphate-sugar epimerase
VSRAHRYALVGHTGFVGSNLLTQCPFEACYNSTNVESIAGESFDLVVCAAARAEKWIANQDPVADRAGIDRLLAALSRMTTTHLVVISTVDVFAAPANVDETAAVPEVGVHAYGANRRYLETALASRFETTILRLPGLYGHGLKKNIIYDFLHDHETDKIDSRGVFQFYGVGRLWADITIALGAQLPVVHLATEPVSVHDVAEHAFQLPFENHVTPSPARYDLHTHHGPLFGGTSPYIESRTRVLEGIRRFVDQERAA